MIFESETAAGSFQKLYEKSEEFLRTKAPRGVTCIINGWNRFWENHFHSSFFQLRRKRTR